MQKSNIHIKLGKTVKKLRKDKKLSQEGLAEKIGMSTDTVSNIERAVASTTLETLEKIATALDVKPHELIQFHHISSEDKAKAAMFDEVFELLKNQQVDILQYTITQIKLLISMKKSFMSQLKR